MPDTLPPRPAAPDPAEPNEADRLPSGKPLSPVIAPLLVRRVGAARMAGVSVASWDRLDAGAKTPAAVRLGGAKLYRVEDLRLWVNWGCPDRREFEARKTAQANGRRS